MAESNILVVDDNREIREIIHILLSGEGYHIEEASDGVQALKQLRKMEFDLIILDVMMPHLNGYQTCMEMRKISNAPILFLSAKSQDDDCACQGAHAALPRLSGKAPAKRITGSNNSDSACGNRRANGNCAQ